MIEMLESEVKFSLQQEEFHNLALSFHDLFGKPDVSSKRLCYLDSSDFFILNNNHTFRYRLSSNKLELKLLLGYDDKNRKCKEILIPTKLKHIYEKLPEEFIKYIPNTSYAQQAYSTIYRMKYLYNDIVIDLDRVEYYLHEEHFSKVGTFFELEMENANSVFINNMQRTFKLEEPTKKNKYQTIMENIYK